jgi:hypothetical protein
MFERGAVGSLGVTSEIMPLLDVRDRPVLDVARGNELLVVKKL